MAPEALRGESIKTSADIYSLGVILYELLTGLIPWSEIPSLQIPMIVGIQKKQLMFNESKFPELVKIAMICLDAESEKRPTSKDLESMIKKLKLTLNPEDGFICPITQELMEDPVVAADGHSYERKAIEGWFSSHNTSPLTNLPLKNKDLIPNHNLRSSIAQYKQKISS